MDDRVTQVNWLRQEAVDLYNNSTYTATDALEDGYSLDEYAANLVGFWVAQMKDGIDERLPTWFDDHDRRLMEDIIRSMEANNG